ncbi:MAG: histidinol-phosphatase [Hyphomicrobiaceae bacterium]
MRATKAPTQTALLACAHSLADASGQVIRPFFRKAIAVDDKGGKAGFDPVTAADRAAEKAIARHLASAFPDHGIIGEEFGTVRPDARFRWVIDPIDGTRAFIMGLPTWGTLIGLMDGADLVLGVMDQPFTGERFWASATAAHLRTADGKTRKIRTRACADLGKAVFSSTHPDLFASPGERAVHDAVKASARMTRYGGDCYAYCLLAAGHIDVIVEPGLKPYDIAALVPIIQRAGGIVTTWDGGPATHGGDIVACGDPALHAKVLRVIAKSGRG